MRKMRWRKAEKGRRFAFRISDDLGIRGVLRPLARISSDEISCGVVEGDGKVQSPSRLLYSCRTLP